MTMRRFFGAFCAALVLLLATPPLVASAQELPELVVINANTEGNNIEVTVVAPDGLDEENIDLNSFSVTVDGVQKLPTIQRIDGSELEVVLLIDTSGSMGGSAIAAAQRAATAFVAEMPAGAQLSVVGFGDSVQVLSEFSTNKADALSAIDGLVAEGKTNLYQAVEVGAALFDPTSSGSRNIILLSDGGDTVADGSLGLAQAAVLASDATLYAVSITTDDSNPEELAAMVEGSGGAVIAVDDIDALDSFYAEVARTISNQYRLAFTGSGDGRVDVFVQANQQGNALAFANIRVELPRRATALVTPTPVPLPTVAPVTTTEPNVFTITAGDDTWLKRIGVGALGLATGLFTWFLITNDSRRRNPLKEYGPVIGRASTTTARGIRRIPHILTGAADRVLSGTERGAYLTRRLEAAGLQIRTSEFAVLIGLLALISFLLGAIVSLLFGFVLCGVFVLGVLAFLSVSISRRQAAFANQLNGTLQLMAGSLRTGYSLPQVFDVVAREAESPTSDEFTRVVIESRLGRDLIDSCHDMAKRLDSEDFEWVVNAMEVTREIGGDLAEVLDNVAGTVRTRERIRRQVKTLSAEGRISAYILVVLPFPMFFWQLFVNREYTLLLFTTGLGRTLFSAGVIALVVGSFWMKRLTRLQF